MASAPELAGDGPLAGAPPALREGELAHAAAMRNAHLRRSRDLALKEADAAAARQRTAQQLLKERVTAVAAVVDADRTPGPTPATAPAAADVTEAMDSAAAAARANCRRAVAAHRAAQRAGAGRPR